MSLLRRGISCSYIAEMYAHAFKIHLRTVEPIAALQGKNISLFELS